MSGADRLVAQGHCYRGQASHEADIKRGEGYERNIPSYSANW